MKFNMKDLMMIGVALATLTGGVKAAETADGPLRGPLRGHLEEKEHGEKKDFAHLMAEADTVKESPRRSLLKWLLGGLEEEQDAEAGMVHGYLEEKHEETEFARRMFKTLFSERT
jgi:hypothetical protein